jgi:G6PDH family F420-dependent oxidoreductase
VDPDPEVVSLFRSSDGEAKPAQAGTKVCWAQDEAQAIKRAHRTWPNEALPGELAQELPTPAHFEQATSLVTEGMISEAFACGPDPERHRQMLREYFEAGYDEVYVQQIGPEQEDFFRFYTDEVLPEFR